MAQLGKFYIVIFKKNREYKVSYALSISQRSSKIRQYEGLGFSLYFEGAAYKRTFRQARPFARAINEFIRQSNGVLNKSNLEKLLEHDTKS